MASTPSYASAAPRVAVGVISTANTARDGTGTGPATAIFSAGASGSKVEEIRVKARGTTTAGMVRIYLWDGSGTDAHLHDEVPVSAITPSATVETFEAVLTYDNLVIPTGWSVTASTHNAETFGVSVFGGDF
jgi:hypothetical protein